MERFLVCGTEAEIKALRERAGDGYKPEQVLAMSPDLNRIYRFSDDAEILPLTVEELGAEDVISVYSGALKRKISEDIRARNSKVRIFFATAAQWVLYKKNQVTQLVNAGREDHYEAPDNLGKWLDSMLHDEMQYWRKRVPECRKKGDPRFKQRPFVYQYNPEIEFSEKDVILDVGCGPLPKFGNLIHGKPVRYLPVDPLAYRYQALLRKLDVRLPVMPRFAIMEVLTSFYGENFADYVIINNALDHCSDILRSLLECIKTVKTGGYVLLEHMEAEGLHNNYSGMHQWNISANCKGELIFFDKRDNYLNVTALLAGSCEITVTRKPEIYRDIIIAKLRKSADLNPLLLERYSSKTLSGKIIDELFRRLSAQEVI